MTTNQLSKDLSRQQIAAFQQARMARDRRFDGRFFVAVKTTGIFCRPICPARLPKETNVSYYVLSIEAMRDGYRPCLRCRPDSAPNSYAWKGVKTTVERVYTLLAKLPPEPIAKIAERLGISERYLHKLMNTEFGLAPKQIQVYHQLMFAKRLLQQSNLAVEDVASAVGFQSARRLQSLMKDHWSLTPSQLRRATMQSSRAFPKLTLFLPYRVSYQWDILRDFLERRKILGVEEITENCYRRVFHEHGANGWIEAEHHPEQQGFQVSLCLDTLKDAPKVLDNLTRVLDLNADPDLVYHALIAAGIKTDQCVYGLRLPGVWSLFEAGCRAILGQQVSVNVAITHLNKFVQELGQKTEFGRVFPEPEAVVKSDLDFLKMPQARKNTLRVFAQYMLETREENFSPEKMLELKGIGPWTLDYMVMRGLSDPDRFLKSDLIVRKMAEKLAINSEKAAPWRSYLTLQLWHIA